MPPASRPQLDSAHGIGARDESNLLTKRTLRRHAASDDIDDALTQWALEGGPTACR